MNSLVHLLLLIATLAIIDIVQAQGQQGILVYLYTSFLFLLETIFFFFLMNYFTYVLVLRSVLFFFLF